MGRTRGPVGSERPDGGGRQRRDGEMDVGVNQEGPSGHSRAAQSVVIINNML